MLRSAKACVDGAHHGSLMSWLGHLNQPMLNVHQLCKTLIPVLLAPLNFTEYDQGLCYKSAD